MITFSHPGYLLALALAPLTLALYGYGLYHKRRAWAAFARRRHNAHLVKIQKRQWRQALCLSAAVGLLGVALAGPQWGADREAFNRQGRDLLILLDVSLSMLAEDVQPNRLERAKTAIARLAAAAQADGNHRLGLVTFAGRASLQCPLTRDPHVFQRRLAAVSTDAAPRKGTLIGDAIRQALRGFGNLDYGHTDLILITDGEDHGSFPLVAAKAAKAHNVGLYIVGLGDDGAGALIPLPKATATTGNNSRDFLTYQDYPVRSRLRQSLLLEIARIAGGVYWPVGLGPLRLEQLYEQHIAAKPRRPLTNDNADGAQPGQRFQWFILAALLLLIIDLLSHGRRA